MDSSIVTDPRFKLLGKKLGISWREAVGSCFLVWMTCYERRIKTLERLEIDAAAEIDGFAEALIGVGLAHTDARERVVIHGVDERIQFLRNQTEKGSRGGRSRRKSTPSKAVTTEANAKHLLPQNQDSAKQTLPQNQDSAQAYSLALTLAPALTPSLSEQESEVGKADPKPQMVPPDELAMSSGARDAAWEQFAYAYPGQSARDPAARLAWDMLPLTEKLVREIMTGLSRWKRCDRWKSPRYVHDAKNFLSREVWLSPPPANEAQAPTPAAETEEDVIRRGREFLGRLRAACGEGA